MGVRVLGVGGVGALVLVVGVARAQPVLPPAPAGVEVTREYGIEFSTIAAPGNRGFEGEFFGVRQGRGSVASSYRMARTDITTRQWLEFYNTFSVQSDALQGRFERDFSPSLWGAIVDATYPVGAPGDRYTLNDLYPQAGEFPVQGISWRAAAVFCNWLHHGRPSDWNLIQNGAYDTTTFGERNGGFTDQLTRNTGARFWIPSLDEWMKAAYYTPNDPANPGSDRYYKYPHQSDQPPTPGLPGTPGAQTTADLDANALGVLRWTVPVASFPDVQSPWGLFDLTDGDDEWTEEVVSPFGRPFGRMLAGIEGFFPARFGTESDLARIARLGDYNLYVPPYVGAGSLRIAAAVPSPAAGLLCIVSCSALGARRRRSHGGGVTH